MSTPGPVQPRERTTELALHLLAKPVQSLLVEEVLEARVAPVVALP